MINSKVPKSVSKIWKIFINSNSRFLTAQEIAQELKMQPNSVLQNINRNEDYFDIINQKPILIGPKPLAEYFFLRDNCKCIFCGSQLNKNESLIDTLDFPTRDYEIFLFNTAVICNSCKSRRHQPLNANMTAELYVQKFNLKNSSNILKRITEIREIEQFLPVKKDKRKSTDNIDSPVLEEKIFELGNKIQQLYDHILIPKSFEYYEVHFFDLTFIDDQNDEINYWGWDWDPDRGYPGGEFEYWYFSQREKVTFQGLPSEKSLDQILDYFGRTGFEIVNMVWLEETNYDNEIQIFFKKQVQM